MKRKMKQPQLDQETARRILENALKANNLEANRIPLEVLASYSNYRRERFTLQRVIIVLVLIAFLLMPLLFIPPKCAMEQVEDVGRGRPAFEVQVDTFLPIRRVTATIDGVNMPVYEVGESLYSIQPTANGEMFVEATLLNGQSAVLTWQVETVDTAPPVLVRDEYKDGMLNLYVADEGLGVNYDTVYALSIRGERIVPVSISREERRISFAYPEDTMNIYIEDMVGNTLQLAVMLSG